MMAKEPGNGQVSLKAVGMIVGTIVVFGSAITSLNLTASDAKYAKEVSFKTAEEQKETNLRLHQVENKQARFEGIMEERTGNIQDTVLDLQGDMKTLLENLELTKDE